MPTFGYDDYDFKKARSDRVKAKLRKLGIDPRSRKYDELYFRFMRR